MNENEKKEKKNNKNVEKNTKSHKIINTLVFLISISYLTYSLINTDDIMTNIYELSIPIFIMLISLALFIGSLRTKKSTGFIAPALIVLLFTIFSFANNMGMIKLKEEETMLSYVNLPYKDLNDWTKKNNIELVVEYENSDTIEKGNIIRLDVMEGMKVKDITKITATVSDGPNYDKIVIIPSMIGWNIEDVTKFIDNNFLINVIIDYEESEDEKDTLIKQSKNGELRRDQELTLTFSIGNKNDLPQNVTMIDLTNKTLFEATLWLKQNGINYKTETEFSETISKDIVLMQNHTQGKEIDITKDEVILTISKGKAINVPNLTKMTVEEVTNWVIENNLKIEFEEIYDENVETGKIINSNVKENDKIESGKKIIVTVSKGQIKMGKFSSLYEFKEWANKYNIKYNETYEYSNTVNKGNVISYSYKENEIVNPDAVITVKVSLGKAITIPSFTGKTKAEAQKTCTTLGIKCSFNTGSYTKYETNIVYAQSRNANTKVASGSSITLTVSKGIPTTKTLYIQQNWLSIGNADATIASLKTQFASNFPGVNFTFVKVKDNTLSSGMISKSSPTNHGSSVKQGNTYTINVVSN